MMTSLAQGRALTSGCRPFTTARPRVAPRLSTVAEARKGSFMVEVEVGEEEPEDMAVRRYMKLVMQSRVVEKLRARKTKETKIEEYKRRFRERVEMRKAGIVEPTYEELYSGEMVEMRPFDDFFQKRDEEDPDGVYDGLAGTADDIFGSFSGGAYTDRWGGSYGSGSYTGAQGGGYMNSGSYGGSSNWQQGGYM